MGMWQRVQRVLREALLGPDVDPDPGIDYRDRRLTGGQGRRDLSPLAHEQMLRVCNWLYDSNPLASWIIDQRIDLLVGDELGYSIELNAKRLKISDEEVRELQDRIKEVLDRFWEHPVFNIRMRADELITLHDVSAELCLPIAALNDVDGVPTIDLVDSRLIKEVRPLPSSSLVFDTVVLTTVNPDGDPKKIIRLNPETGRLEGDCFYFRNSYIPNQMRGRSELLRQADWLDTFDQFLWARADRAALMNNLLYDVTLKNANSKTVKERAAEIRKDPPTVPGTVNVHNDAEEWKAIVPDLKAEDATGEARLLRTQVLGSKSIPESWFSSGGEVTRTTAGEQNDIALMAMRRRRKRVKMIFQTMLEFAYDRLQEKQEWVPPRAGGGVKLTPDLPPLDERDISRLGGVVQNLEAALEAAIDRELVSQRTARKVFMHVVDRLGVPVDPDDEERQIEAEAEDRELRLQRQADAAAAARLAQVPQPGVPKPDDEEEPVTV